MTSNPLISIVTINYNNTGLTEDLLRSVLCLEYSKIEVIVVDNASEQDPSEQFKKILPSVNIILSKKNLGFAGGNNLGIKAAKGEYLFFVNNDTELTPGILNGLLEIFKHYPDAGVVSPKFHYYYAPGTIEFAGYKSINSFTARNSMIGCRTKDEGQYDAISKTNYGHGGGMMVSRQVIDKVGLMPEVYFLYYEEFDWCEKIKKKGYNIYYQYKSLIYHKESMSVGKNSTLKTFYLNRNRILFMRRNVKGLSFLGFAFYYTFFTLPKNTFSFLVRKETDHLKAFWKGLIWNLSNRNLKKIELCAE